MAQRAQALPGGMKNVNTPSKILKKKAGARLDGHHARLVADVDASVTAGEGDGADRLVRDQVVADHGAAACRGERAEEGGGQGGGREGRGEGRRGA